MLEIEGLRSHLALCYFGDDVSVPHITGAVAASAQLVAMQLTFPTLLAFFNAPTERWLPGFDICGV